MRIDTDVCRSLSASFRSLQATCSVPASLTIQKLSVSRSLEQLSLYFTTLADQAEAAENQKAFFVPGKVVTSHREYWNLGRQLNKQPAKTTLTGSLDASWKTGSLTAAHDKYTATGKVDLLKAHLKGTASMQFWKDKKFDPKADLAAEGSLCAASAQLSASWKPVSGLNVSGYAKGEVGAVYGKAEAVLSKEELSIEGTVGAAAVRGECSLSFSFMGAIVTLTGTGSLGSAEASFSYHHKNKEWEMGSKLGFIAGLGFKIKVNY